MQEEMKRSEFESWWNRRHSQYTWALEKDPKGIYIYFHAHLAWEAWQESERHYRAAMPGEVSNTDWENLRPDGTRHRVPKPTNEVSHLLGKYLNTMVADLRIESEGQYLRDLFSRYEAELARAATTTEPVCESCGRLKSRHFAGDGCTETGAATKAETCPTCGGNCRSLGYVAGLAIHGNRPELCTDPWHSPATAPQPESPISDGTQGKRVCACGYFPHKDWCWMFTFKKASPAPAPTVEREELCTGCSNGLSHCTCSEPAPAVTSEEKNLKEE